MPSVLRYVTTLIFQTNHVTFVMRSTTHLLLGRCCRTHSKQSFPVIWYRRSKSSGLEIRNGCSNTRLLFADGWWYWRAPVSVLRRIKPKEKLILKTVGWYAKIRFSYSRRLAGLMVERRKLYQPCKRFWRLKRVRICGQCHRYVWATFSSLAGISLAGMRIGSGCPVAAAFSALWKLVLKRYSYLLGPIS